MGSEQSPPEPVCIQQSCASRRHAALTRIRADMDSDTEPESQVSVTVEGWDAADFAHIATTQALCSSQTSSQDMTPSGSDVEQAIRDLRSLDLEEVQKDDSLHGVIQVASTTILTYLDNVVVSLPQDIGDIESAMSTLMDPENVALLFAYRQVFYVIAAREVHVGMASSAVVCWVDVVFAKLGEAITTVAAGSPPSTDQSADLHASMQKQFESHLLRAATQLPSTWSALPTVLSAAHASPAACRLAMRLLYGIYVLRPYLQEINTLNSASSADSKKLIAALRCYLDRTPGATRTASTTGIIDADGFGTQDRVTCAMFLSLFAVTDPPQDSDITNRSQVPFRPNTDAALLRHVMGIMCPTSMISMDMELVTPSPSLDAAQTVFLRHPATIGWCWKVWNDPRIAHAEIIDHLTANWLYHVGKASGQDRTSHNVSWDADVFTALEASPTTACAALIRFINRGVSVMSDIDKQLPSAVQDVLYRAASTCATYSLIDDETNGQDSLVTELCTSFGRLFFHLPQDPIATVTKDVILEGLTLVRTDTIRTVMEKLFSYGSDLKARLEHSISTHARSFPERVRRNDTDISDLRQSLQFLTLLWRSRAQLEVSGSMTDPLLRGLFDSFSSGDASPDTLTSLRSPLLLALSASSMFGHHGDITDKSWTDEAAWTLVLNAGVSDDLALAAAFSVYVCVTHNKCQLDALYFADGWNYLRDILLLVLTHHYLDVEEPLALLVAPSICMALTCLIASGDDRAVTYILSSPLTMNLCISLKGISQSRKRGDDYLQHLQRRIAIPASQLLAAINDVLSAKAPANIVDVSACLEDSKLIFARLRDVLQLLLVPQ